jgi:hypothetical protein
MKMVGAIVLVRQGWLVAVVSCLSLSVVAQAADPDAVRRAFGEMMAASRTMVDSGERRDFERMATEAGVVVEAGERVLAALPRPGNRHARDAAEHVRGAMDHARLAVEAAHRGQDADALTHARKALSQIRRGAGHAEAL